MVGYIEFTTMEPIRVNTCPITNNLPTKMSKKTFEKMCKRHRKNKIAWQGFAKARPFPSYCSGTCKGQLVPKGISFFEEESNGMRNSIL